MHFPVTVLNSMLVSTKVILQLANKRVLERDWRIVVIPEEDAPEANVLSLFQAIVDHTYDSDEPLSLSPEQLCGAIQAKIGKAQDSQHFQDVPLVAKLAEVVAPFGMFFKFIVLSELQSSTASCVTVPGPARSAFEVGEFRYRKY